MIYRVHKLDRMNESFGYEYFSNKRDMLTNLKKYDSVQEHETPKNKQEMIHLLRQWARHNDNG